MGCGVIQAGSEKFVESEWHDNPMPSLYNDDAIHAFRIRMSEELRVLDLAKVNDPTLKSSLIWGALTGRLPTPLAVPEMGLLIPPWLPPDSFLEY